LAVSRVTIHHGNIGGFFSRSPLAGTSVGAGRGFGHGDARAIAARMALAARLNTGAFHQRTGSLVTSVVPIVREFPGGGTEVGVGTTVEHGYWLEAGTDFHYIDAPPFPRATLWDSGSKGEVPEEWKLRGSHKRLPHPGNDATHWLSNAVRSVIPGAIVNVRKHF